MSDDKIAVAYINKCWGVKGEVIAEPLTEFPQRFKKLRKVYVQTAREEIPLTVQWQKIHGNRIVIKFEGFDDRDEVNRLRNSYILIDKEQVHNLPDGNYYHFDLVGLQVYHNGDFLGEIDEVWEYPASDIFVIRSEKGRLLIPAIKSVIKNISLDEKRMEVELLPGMEFEAE